MLLWPPENIVKIGNRMIRIVQLFHPMTKRSAFGLFDIFLAINFSEVYEVVGALISRDASNDDVPSTLKN